MKLALLFSKVQLWSIIVSIIVACMAPVILSGQIAHGAQLTSRKITIGSSKTSQTDVTYTAVFTLATTAALEGIVFDFCSDSPIVGLTCTAPSTFDVNESGLAVSVSGHSGATAFTKHANTDTNTLILTRTDSTSNTSGTTVTVTLGSSGGADGMTNPSTTGSFYARVLTYSASATAAAYTSTSPGSYTDTGGIALSTANQLTITARVQEVLQFCVGTTDANSANDCTDISGTSIDLGVVDSSAVAASANDAGKAMIRTNAVSGVVVDYFAEQNTSSGKLKVAGATCSGTSLTDQCFNSTGTTQNSIVAGTEEFGMTVEAVNTTNGTTTNITRDSQYDGSAGGYAWDDTGTVDRIASSTTVVDDEMLELKFAATAGVTTPTGQYTVTSTYIATATF